MSYSQLTTSGIQPDGIAYFDNNATLTTLFTNSTNKMIESNGAGGWRLIDTPSANEVSGVSVLTDLDDVGGSPENNQVLTYNSTLEEWNPQPVTLTLNGLSNVSGTPANNQVLTYITASGEWLPTDAPTGSGDNDQIAIWGTNTIAGDANFTWDGNLFYATSTSTSGIAQFTSTSAGAYVLINSKASWDSGINLSAGNDLKWRIRQVYIGGEHDFSIANQAGQGSFSIDSSTGNTSISNGLKLGNTSTMYQGMIRWNSFNYQGYKTGGWVNLDEGVSEEDIDHGAISGLNDDDHTQYLLAAGTRALTADWDAGAYKIRARQLQSDVATGTSPLVIASTTVVTNLNADRLDGNHASAFALSANGVTNGDSHDHSGGDGAQIDHTTLSNKGTNTHSQIDSHISSNHVNSFNTRTGAVTPATNDYTWAQINKTTSDIADIATKSHTSLTDKGTNTHSQIDTHLGAASPHSSHVIIGSNPLDNRLAVWNNTTTIEGDADLTWDGTTLDVAGNALIGGAVDSNRSLSIAANEQYSRYLLFKTGNSIRWAIICNSAAETGGNEGSDFSIARYADNGSYLGNVLHANRETGDIRTYFDLIVDGNLTVNDSYNVASGIQQGTYTNIQGANGTWTTSIQDGNGRVNMYWNAYPTGSDTWSAWKANDRPSRLLISNTGRLDWYISTATPTVAGESVTWNDAAFTIENTGNVGIGDESPNAKLDVGGNIGTTGDIIIRTSSQGIRTDTSNGADNQYVRFTGGGGFGDTRGAQVTAFGNEVIGFEGLLSLVAGNDAALGTIRMTTGNTTRLTVEYDGDITCENALTLGTTINTIDGTIRWTDTDFEGRKSGAWVSLTDSGGDVYKVPTPVNERVAFWTGDGTLGHHGDFTWDGNVLRIDGSVAIGTSTSNSRLYMGRQDTTAINAVQFTTSGEAQWRLEGYYNGTGLRIYDDVNNKTVTTWHPNSNGIVFNENNQDRDFRVETQGVDDTLFVQGNNDRVGIKTDTPSEALDVNGNIAVNGTVDGLNLQTHNHSGANQGGTIAHTSLSSIGTDDHHPQSHNIASHSDTSATGPELNTLTNGGSSDADSLHTHGTYDTHVSAASPHTGHVVIGVNPADTRLAVWTGSTTVKGASSLTWDGSDLGISGGLTASANSTIGGGVAGERNLSIAANDGYSRRLLFKSGNAIRWGIICNDTEETGSSAGSDFRIGSYSDASAYASRLLIDRASGDVTVAQNFDVGGNITVSGTVDGRDVATDGSTLDTHVGAASPHSGHPDISGTPEINQVALWTDSNTLKGNANLTYGGTALTIAGNLSGGGLTLNSTTGAGISLDRDNTSAACKTTYRTDGIAQWRTELSTGGTNDFRLYDIAVSSGIIMNCVQGSEVVFNESSKDLNFRVESDAQTHMLFVDGGTDKVGIGTDSPNGTFDISCPGSDTPGDCDLMLSSNTDVGLFGFRISPSTDSYRYLSLDRNWGGWHNEPAICIDRSTGDIGFNTIPGAYTFHLNERTASNCLFLMTPSTDTQDSVIYMATTSGNTDGMYLHSDGATDTLMIGGRDGGVNTPHMRIERISGNVGIGGQPSYPLHVYTSDANVTANSTVDELVVESNASTGMSILSGSTSLGTLAFGRNGGSLSGAVKYDHDISTMILRAGGGDRVWINPAGKVGIGATPSDFLEITGALGAGGITVDSSNGANINIDRGTDGHGCTFDLRTAGVTQWQFALAAGGGSNDLRLIDPTNSDEVVRFNQGTGIIVNSYYKDRDFKIAASGIDNQNMFFVDGGEARIGIGTNAPAAFMHLETPDSNPNLSTTTNSLRISLDGGNAWEYLNVFKYNAFTSVIQNVAGINNVSNLLLEAIQGSTSTKDAFVGINRFTETTGDSALRIFNADGTDDENCRLGCNVDSFLNVNTGNVGIGQDVPSRKLTVLEDTAQTVATFGTANITSALLSLTDFNTTLDTSVGIGAIGNNLAFRAGNNYKAHLTSDGDLGIGEDTPLTKLHIVDTSQSLDSGDIFNVQLLIEDADAGICIASNEVGTWGSRLCLSDHTGATLNNTWGIVRQTSDDGDNSLHFTYGTDVNVINNTPVLVLDPAGSVGIGIDTPGFPLHVYHVATDTVALFKSGDSSVAISLADGNTLNTENNQIRAVGEELRLKAGGTATLFVKNDRVGIGATATTEQLEVEGAIKIGDAAGTGDGTIRWNATNFEGRKGGWVRLDITDHGDLSGKDGDAHPQYLLVADIDTVPTEGATSVPVSSAWVYTHAVTLSDPHPIYRKESEDHSHQSTGLQGGKLDHGLALDGLGDDDHTQYLTEARHDLLAADNPHSVTAAQVNAPALGTRADNQIAIWNGTTTLDGDANLTWDGTTLDIDGGTLSDTNGTELDMLELHSLTSSNDYLKFFFKRTSTGTTTATATPIIGRTVETTDYGFIGFGTDGIGINKDKPVTALHINKLNSGDPCEIILQAPSNGVSAEDYSAISFEMGGGGSDGYLGDDSNRHGIQIVACGPSWNQNTLQREDILFRRWSGVWTDIMLVGRGNGVQIYNDLRIDNKLIVGNTTNTRNLINITTNNGGIQFLNHLDLDEYSQITGNDGSLIISADEGLNTVTSSVKLKVRNLTVIRTEYSGVTIGGDVSPANKLDVDGAVVIGSGSSYAGSATAPTNGLLVEGDVECDDGLLIGTSTIPHGNVGMCKLAIHGTNGNAAGPHVQFTTGTTDDYPLMQIMPWAHDNVQINFDAFFNGTAWRSSDAGSNFQIRKSNDMLRFRYDSGVATGVGGTVDWIEGIVLDTNGHVGIGQTFSTTTTPKAELHINKGSENTFAAIQLEHNGAATGTNGQWTGIGLSTKGDGELIGGTNQGWRFIAYGDSYNTSLLQNELQLLYYNGSTNNYAMRFDTSGQVGIGVNETPSYTLDVRASASGSYVARIDNRNDTDGDKGLVILCGSATPDTAGDCRWIGLLDGDGTVWSYIQSAGTSGAEFSTPSDARLKTNINPTAINGLDVITNLPLRQFDWINKSNSHQDIGFIAQEVQDVYPSMVSYDKENDTYMVADGTLVPVLVKAVQEQQDVIEEQKQKINSLESRLAALETLLIKE